MTGCTVNILLFMLPDELMLFFIEMMMMWMIMMKMLLLLLLLLWLRCHVCVFTLVNSITSVAVQYHTVSVCVCLSVCLVCVSVCH